MAKPKQETPSVEETKTDSDVTKEESTNAGPSNAAPPSSETSQALDADTEANAEVKGPTAEDFKSHASKMEKAPRDGSRILAITDEDEPVVVSFDERLNAYVDRHGFTVIPTHWVPVW